MVNETVEEISLRDVYLILKKNIRLIVGITLAAIILAGLAAFLLPKSYSSQVVMNLAIDLRQTLDSKQLGGSKRIDASKQTEITVAPTPAGLAQSFVQSVNNESLAQKLKEESSVNIYKAKYDDKKELLTLSAFGTTAELALERAKRFQTVAEEYFILKIGNVVRTNLTSQLAQIQVDTALITDNIKRLEAVLPKMKGSPSDPTTAAALEDRDVNQPLARANNPALVSLTLQIAELRINLAEAQARQVSLQATLKNPVTFNALLGQGFQAQVLAEPALALSAESPKPLIMIVLAAVAGLLIGLVTAFVLEALRPQNQNELTRGTNQPLQASSGD